MVTQDVNFVVTADDIDRAVAALTEAGFACERVEWSVNFHGLSKVSVQLSTEEVYLEFLDRAVPAEVHEILMRVAALEDTLSGKILAWKDPSRRQSIRAKGFADIVRLVESHPELREKLPQELDDMVESPQ